MDDTINALCMSCTKHCKQSAACTVIECLKYDYNGGKLPTEPAEPKSGYRELTAYEKGAIKELVTSSCANYQSDYDICVLLETPCPMLLKHYHNGKLCKYFENAVLPTNTKLELCLQDKIGLAKKCAVCGSPFLPNGRQVYCGDSCREKGNREKEKLKKRKQRKNRG